MKNDWRLYVVFLGCFVLAVSLQGKAFPGECWGYVIQSIDLENSSRADVIVIQTDRPIEDWHDFTLETPDRIVIDLYDCQCPGRVSLGKSEGQLISALRFARYPGKIRIAADIKKDATGFRWSVERKGNILEIHTERALDFTGKESGRIVPLNSEPEEGGFSSAGDSDADSFFEESDKASPSFEQESGFGGESAGDMEKTPWEQAQPEKRSPFEFSGNFRNLFTGDIRDDNEFEDDNFNHAALQLEGKYDFNPNLYAVLGVDLNHFAYRNGGDWEGDVDLRFWNAYLNFSGTSYNLRVGNQIVKWGKADEVGPLDLVNPEDYREGLLQDRSDRKVPVPMINLELFKGVYKLQGVFIPFFEKSDIDIVGRNWALFDHYKEEVGNFRTEEEDYPNSLENSGAGTRFSGTIANLDYGFYYLHNRDSLPSIDSLIVPPGFPLPVTSNSIKDLARFAHTTGQPIRLKYDRRHIGGVDFETTLGDFGVRGEFAYISKKSFLTNELESISKPMIQYVLGADYNGPRSFYINLQFAQSIILDYEDKILFSEKYNNVINGKITKGILDDNVELSFRYLYGITEGDCYYNPAVILKYWQNVTFEIGAEFVDGPENTLLGVFENNDEVYVILEWYF